LDGIFEKQSPDLRSTWQRRYFVLRGNTIFYWKEQEGAEIGNQQGDFLLHSTSSVTDVKSKGRYFHFAINQVSVLPSFFSYPLSLSHTLIYFLG
jgi:hypothetical protein